MKNEELDKLKKLKAFQLLPTVSSKDIEWINWMKALTSDFDRATSVAIFLNLWSKRGTSQARTLQLRGFMKDKYNVDLGEGVLDKVVDLGGGITDTIGGIFHAGKVFWMVGLGVTTVAIIAVVYAVAKNPSAIMMATPAGRAAKLLGK